MALIYKNRVAETTGTGGTGTITGAGAIAQYQTFDVIGTGNQVSYTLLSGNGTDWECGQGTITISGGTRTMSRDTVEESSAGGARISLTGTSTVFVSVLASRATLSPQALWGPAMLSGVPTSASTGLTNWANQGSATVNDRTTGITLTIPSAGADEKYTIRYKTVPSTPYSFKALVAVTGFSGNGMSGALGWYDGTKAQFVRIFHGNGAWNVAVTHITTLTGTATNDFLGTAGQGSPVIWLRIRDDGTTVYFGASLSGDDNDFQTLYSVAKASGNLGASGYINPFFGGAANGAIGNFTLLAWEQGV